MKRDRYSYLRYYIKQLLIIDTKADHLQKDIMGEVCLNRKVLIKRILVLVN
jgi:predicted YcjX-like family ATPase